MSPEHRAKIAESHRGKKRSDLAGENNPAKRPEVREKLRQLHLGKPKPTIRGNSHWTRQGRGEELDQRATATKKCECGFCDEIIPMYESAGNGRFNNRIRRFAPGHQVRGKKRPDFTAWIKENHHKQNHPKGENHWAWKGGISAWHKLERQSKEYKGWRDAVYARDGWTCQWPGCGKHLQKGNIVAHHVMSFWEYPSLRYKVDNGITYCRRHHAMAHDLGDNPKVPQEKPIPIEATA